MASGTRTPYTDEDDQLLLKYLAKYCPGTKDRLGNKIYQQLTENADGKWPFARRHPWSSWRERYKKHSDWFDSKIRRYQRKHDLVPDEEVAGTQERKAKVPFTEKDDLRLAKYLATENQSGQGRMGNMLYKGLVEGADGERPWAANHTWHSWRDRYINKRDWFDDAIAEYLKRRNVKVKARSRSTRPRVESEDEAEVSAEERVRPVRKAAAKAKSAKSPSKVSVESEDESEPSHRAEGKTSQPGRSKKVIAQKPARTRSSTRSESDEYEPTAEEEIDELEDDEEADTPVPAQAKKRKRALAPEPVEQPKKRVVVDSPEQHPRKDAHRATAHSKTVKVYSRTAARGGSGSNAGNDQRFADGDAANPIAVPSTDDEDDEDRRANAADLMNDLLDDEPLFGGDDSEDDIGAVPMTQIINGIYESANSRSRSVIPNLDTNDGQDGFELMYPDINDLPAPTLDVHERASAPEPAQHIPGAFSTAPDPRPSKQRAQSSPHDRDSGVDVRSPRAERQRPSPAPARASRSETPHLEGNDVPYNRLHSIRRKRKRALPRADFFESSPARGTPVRQTRASRRALPRIVEGAFVNGFTDANGASPLRRNSGKERVSGVDVTDPGTGASDEEEEEEDDATPLPEPSRKARLVERKADENWPPRRGVASQDVPRPRTDKGKGRAAPTPPLPVPSPVKSSRANNVSDRAPSPEAMQETREIAHRVATLSQRPAWPQANPPKSYSSLGAKQSTTDRVPSLPIQRPVGAAQHPFSQPTPAGPSKLAPSEDHIDPKPVNGRLRFTGSPYGGVKAKEDLPTLGEAPDGMDVDSPSEAVLARRISGERLAVQASANNGAGRAEPAPPRVSLFPQPTKSPTVIVPRGLSVVSNVSNDPFVVRTHERVDKGKTKDVKDRDLDKDRRKTIAGFRPSPSAPTIDFIKLNEQNRRASAPVTVRPASPPLHKDVERLRGRVGYSSRSSSVSDISVLDEESEEFMRRAGFNDVVRRMSANQGFTEDVVRRVVETVGSFKIADKVLEVMRNGAQAFGEDYIEKDLGPYMRAQESRSRSSSRRASGAQELEIIPTAPSGAPSGYTPPDASRAGQYRRLQKQGRPDEAREREVRRASTGGTSPQKVRLLAYDSEAEPSPGASTADGPGDSSPIKPRNDPREPPRVWGEKEDMMLQSHDDALHKELEATWGKSAVMRRMVELAKELTAFTMVT